MDEEEIKEKRRILLNCLKRARALAAEDKFDESKKLLKTYSELDRQIFGIDAAADKFNDLRNAINNMSWPLEGNERMIKNGEQLRDRGKKDSLRLIAELEEELAD